MNKINDVIKKHLKTISEDIDMGDNREENYMFFGNIEQMKRQCDILMNEDKQKIDSILKEHDWAQDHITEAKSLLDQVFDFLMNKTKDQNNTKEFKADLGSFSLNETKEIDESKNKPTNPKLWAASLAWAKSKYKVCPSAYCNGAAAKRYKSKGGKWKTNEEVNESKKDDYKVYHNTYTSAINAALEYAESRGYEYDKEETSDKIGLGPKKPEEGKTNKFSISLTKDGKPQRKNLQIQVYGMGNKYELNCYIS